MSLLTMEKGASGGGLDSQLDRVLAAKVVTSTEEGAGMTHWCGKNCTVLSTRLARVFET